MLKLTLIVWLLFSLAWRTTPTSCRQTRPPQTIRQLLATQLQSYMDTTARPCENFYQYACGNWQLQQEQPSNPREREKDREREQEQLLPSDTLSVLDHNLNRQLEMALRRSNESTMEEEPPIYDKLRLYYRSCKRLKPYNLKKYLQLLSPGNGTHWPLLSRSWRREKFHWLTTIGRLRLHGLNGVLLKEQVLPRWDDSSVYSIYLDKPSLVETLPMGEGAMIELLLDIGQTKRVANALARQVDDFERRLHRLQELEDDEGAKEMQLGYLEEYLPELKWLLLMREIRVDTEPDVRSTLIIQNIPYMRALHELVERQPPDTICNYIMLKWLAFLKQQGPAEISRGECVASMRRAMPLASSLMIGQRLYDPEAEQDVGSLFQQLKRRFALILEENRLQLAPPIVHVLQEKLRAMRLQLGFVQLNDSGYVEEYYQKMELNGHNFYANQLKLLRLRVEKNHELLSATGTDLGNVSYLTESWLASSSSPLYVKPRNLVLMPYGLLQLPVWHRNTSSLQRHAVLGFALAHELIHGYDASGIDYDGMGNIMGPSEEIAGNQRFIQGLRCMQQQLATGSRSLNEKLADYEALRLVYETFFGLKAKPREPRDPLLSQFSQRQLFFISFGQFFCGKMPALSLQAQSHLEHAIDELRVMQTLANFEEFSREFGCEKRTKMQAKQRCRVW
ncbi:GL25525 [Drosophila persimilis]|uniref:GL25525 n=1 Tax=Drosophila persimilis TaxID=7234 RepID=B4GJC9_DROPE|nr:neprilysin-4 [Drosophila persimilis]EDW37443.1 GL25525 [Drosophila persimilis]